MPNFLIHQQWLLIAFIVFGIIGYIAWIRWRDHKWIESRFGKRQTLAMSFGVNYFGRATEPGKPKRSSGFLLLFPERLFYRSRLAGLEVDVPTNASTVSITAPLIKTSSCTNQWLKSIF